MKKTGTLTLAVALLWFATAVSADEPVRGTHVFNERGFQYVLQYPAGWLCYTQAYHTVLFIGKSGKEKDYPTVMIKSLSAASKGGAFRDVDGVIGDLEDQLSITTDAVLFNPEPFTYRKDGLALKGTQCVTEYTIRNERFKEWTVVIPGSNNDLFYVWAYTSPDAVYDVYLPVAKAMFDSWVMKE